MADPAYPQMKPKREGLMEKRRKTKPFRPPKKERQPSRLLRISFLPSLFTLFSLFLGFWALQAIIHGEFLKAVFYNAISVLLDGFDGTIARLTKTESDFGMHLDSLSDGVTFGLIPGMLIYFWGFKIHLLKIGGIIGFVFLSAGLIRLARFNVYKERHILPDNVFIGLPIPLSALAIGSWVLLFRGEPHASQSLVIAFGFFSLLISFLMVSNIHYKTIKNVQQFNNPRILLVLAVVVGAAILYPLYTIPAVSFLYLISPLFFLLIKKKKGSEAVSTAETTSP